MTRWIGLAVAGVLAAGAGFPSIARAQAPATATEAQALTLDEAVQRALDRNLDIAVERLNPQVFDFQLAALRSSYLPTATSTIGERSQVNPPTSQLNGGQRVTNDTFTYNGGLAQALPWGGTSFTFNWNNSRNNTSNIFANFNPSYQSNFTAVLTQPLLRGFRIDGVRQQLLVTQINRDISEIQLRATITNTLASVRNAYWDLTFALRAVDVARQSLELAQKLVEDNRTRVEVGAMAPIDVVEAEAEAASRQQALAQAEATALTAELALKRLIVDGTQDPLWKAPIRPVDQPTFEREDVDIDGAVRSALSKRSDLAESRRQLDSNDVTLRFLRNQRLPAVDAVASYGLQGLGGTQYIRQGSGLGSIVTGTIPGGFGDALRNIGRADFPTWNVAVNISYPLFGSAADANYARARVQRNQTAAEVKALELRAATEVTGAAVQVQSTVKRVEAATAARSLAERRLEAEQSKFEVGLSTNFFVVQAQRDLADAQITELRALADHRKALVEFERVQETSLQGTGITVIGGAGGAR